MADREKRDTVGVDPLGLPGFADTVVADVSDVCGDTCEPVLSRAPTAKLAQRITVDLEDADQLAEFLETVARLVRDKRRLVITVE